MVFFEFLGHLLSFDFTWIVEFIFANLLWLFMFAAVVVFYAEGRKFLWGFVLTILLLWTNIDFSSVSGWVWAVAAFMMIYYVSRVVVMVFFADVKKTERYLPIIFTIQFLIVFIIFNTLLA